MRYDENKRAEPACPETFGVKPCTLSWDWVTISGLDKLGS
jgi:hypothetical protein